jgi:hypothetical protein
MSSRKCWVSWNAGGKGRRSQRTLCFKWVFSQTILNLVDGRLNQYSILAHIVNHQTLHVLWDVYLWFHWHVHASSVHKFLEYQIEINNTRLSLWYIYPPLDVPNSPSGPEVSRTLARTGSVFEGLGNHPMFGNPPMFGHGPYDLETKCG